MFFYIIPIVISSLLLLNLDWGVFNTTLLIMFCISCSELLRNLSIIFNNFINDNSLEKSLELKINLDKQHKILIDFNRYLKDAAKETAKLQLKSLYVLLMWAVQQNNKNEFDGVIKKLQELKVPNEYLTGHKKMEEFIKKVESDEYSVDFEKNTGQAYFSLNSLENKENN